MSFPVYNKSTRETINFDTKEERDNYISTNDLSIYQGELPEVVVTAKRTATNSPWFQDVFGSGNPIWGQNRVANYARVESHHPDLSQKYDTLANIGEGTNLITGGIFNMLSPSQQIHAITSDNYLTSILGGNSGIRFTKNPYMNFVANSIFDYIAFNPVKALTAIKLAPSKYYTGVQPYNIRRFRSGKYQGDIWTSNKPQAGYMYSGFNTNGIFPVVADESKLKILEIPDLKNSQFSNLPVDLSGDFPKVDFTLPSSKRVTTDQIVSWSKKHGYDATRIKGIYDNANNMEELIIHSGTPREVGDAINVSHLFSPLHYMNIYNNLGAIDYNKLNKEKQQTK